MNAYFGWPYTGTDACLRFILFGLFPFRICGPFLSFLVYMSVTTGVYLEYHSLGEENGPTYEILLFFGCSPAERSCARKMASRL
jgi:hypothetical protein